MSEGRTPTATLTERRGLEQEDIDVLHQIVIRAQNDPQSTEKPKDALLQAYGEIFKERRLSQHQDRACFNILLRLLDPSTVGESLYHKFEGILQDDGIVLSYEDDATTTTHDAPQSFDDRMSEDQSEQVRPISSASQQGQRVEETGPARTAANGAMTDDLNDEAYIDYPPNYIAPLMQFAIRKDRVALLRQTLDAFQRAVEIEKDRREEELANSFYEARLKRKTLKQCLVVFQDFRDAQIQADQIYNRKLARNALGKTRDEYRVRRIGSIGEDRVKGLSLYKWTIASRESTFVRNRAWYLKKTFLQKLVQSYKANQAQQERLEWMLERKKTQNQNSLLRSAMVFLGQKSIAVQVIEAKADQANQGALCAASISAWRAKMGKLGDLALTAEDAREYFLMMRVLKQLQFVTRFRRERRIWLATWTLKKWREHVKACKHARYDEAYRQMRRRVKMNLARRLLHRWQQKIHDYREQDAQADAFYQTSILQRFAKPVVEVAWDTAEWMSKSESIADQRANQSLQQRALVALQQKQQYLEAMSDRADRLRQYRLEQRAVQGLRQMQLKAFEFQRRQFDADAFLNRHDKRGVRNIMAKMRRVLAEQRGGGEGALTLNPAPAVTPARKREELLFNTSTRLSTTPAYTPFAARLRAEPRILEEIEDDEDLEAADVQDQIADAASEG